MNKTQVKEFIDNSIEILNKEFKGINETECKAALELVSNLVKHPTDMTEFVCVVNTINKMKVKDRKMVIMKLLEGTMLYMVRGPPVHMISEKELIKAAESLPEEQKDTEYIKEAKKKIKGYA